MTKIQYTLAIRRSLTAEDLNFSAYVLMLLLSGCESMSIARLAVEAGMNYSAVKNQVYRNAWFRTATRPGGPLRTGLTPEGREKLARLEKRIQSPA